MSALERAPGRAGGPGLLVVDHDPATRELLRECLAGAGFRSDEAGDSETALARVGGGGPAAVVLHDHARGERGLEILRALRAHHPALPVIFIARFEESDTRTAATALAATHVDKPFRIADLVATVRRALKPEAAESARARPRLAGRGDQPGGPDARREARSLPRRRSA
ncbi:MAG TPA: response regulator [Methylomirabilota bacterium]|jgi:DNA-binding response OmpR family regulator|nr:response regulator [Methylomirabilota bacterium]